MCITRVTIEIITTDNTTKTVGYFNFYLASYYYLLTEKSYQQTYDHSFPSQNRAMLNSLENQVRTGCHLCDENINMQQIKGNTYMIRDN
jgi:hypothetical protein